MYTNKLGAWSAAEPDPYGVGVLLERDGEMAALRSCLGAAGAEGGALAVIQGPPGMGKTRLLAAAADHARATGLRVLTGCGRELERDIALGTAIELLAPAVTAAGPLGRSRLLAGPAAPAAALFAEDVDPSAYPTPDSMLLGLCWLAANLAASRADGPLLVAVDDAQWVDAGSLRFLAMLADRVPALPLVLVIAIRDGDQGQNRELRWLSTHPKARQLRPAPLTVAAVGRLVTDAFPAADAALTDAVGYASGGNPFLVGELLHSLRADGVPPDAAAVAALVPDTVLRSVLARVARLPTDTAGLATSAAVLGDGAPLRRVAAHAGLELVAAERAADELAAACLLRPGNPVTFTHPLIGAAIHADLPAFTRARAHRRAADLLAADGEPAERVAGHLLAVEPESDARVVAVLREAADTALRRGDPAAAARLLTRARTEPPPPEQRGAVLVALADAQLTGGDLAAHDVLTEALGLLDPTDRDTRVQALTLLARVRKGLGDFTGAVNAWETALSLFEPAEPGWQDVLAGYLTTATFYPPTRRHAERHVRPVLERTRAGAPPPDRPGLAAHVTLRLALAGDPAPLVRRLAEHILAPDPLLGPHGESGALMALVVHGLVIAGELDAAERAADAALAAAGQRGDVLAYGYASYHRALARLRRGKLTSALADLHAAQVPYTVGWTASGGWNSWLVAQVHLEYGDLATAHEILHQADDRPDDSMESALAGHVRAQLALAEGRPSEALELATRAGGLLHQNYDIDHPGLLPWRRTAALAAHHVGDHDQAREVAAAALHRARETGIPQAIGTALRVVGLVARPTDIAALTEAADLLATSPATLDHAHALADLGAALRRAGDHTACRQPLRQALAIAERAHARPLAEHVRAELRVLGLRPRRAATSGVEALTPAESRVALLALHGLSNPQIAQTLFITAKTVETHLARAYRKLAISNRRQLRDVLA